MKYGESVFDILYLIFAVTSGCLMLCKTENRTKKMMGLAALILGCGDAFHLIPRVLNYFVEADLTASLGIGKLITSISMTVFYLLLYYIWLISPLQVFCWWRTLLQIRILVFLRAGRALSRFVSTS